MLPILVSAVGRVRICFAKAYTSCGHVGRRKTGVEVEWLAAEWFLCLFCTSCPVSLFAT